MDKQKVFLLPIKTSSSNQVNLLNQFRARVIERDQLIEQLYTEQVMLNDYIKMRSNTNG